MTAPNSGERAATSPDALDANPIPRGLTLSRPRLAGSYGRLALRSSLTALGACNAPGAFSQRVCGEATGLGGVR